MCFIYRHNYMVHSFIIHRFFQCVFANFCYQFQPFFVHMHRYFPWGFLEVFLKQFSQHFFIGFFTGVFIGSLLKLWSQVFSQGFSQAYFSGRFFHRVLNFEIFLKFRLCKIHRVFHRVFSCHRVFHIIIFHSVFTGFHPIVEDSLLKWKGQRVICEWKLSRLWIL